MLEIVYTHQKHVNLDVLKESRGKKMKVTQIYQLLEEIYTEITGQSGVVNEDLSNIVDIGSTFLEDDYRDKYVNSLLNRIGRMVFVDRPYTGFAPSILRDAWDYGSIMSKSRVKDFTPTDNMAWHLTPGESVDQFIYTPPTVQTTLYNEMVAWEIDCSFVRDQLTQSFTSATEYDRFISMIQTQIQNSLVQQIDSLIMRNINTMMGRRISTNIAVVDLLQLYNTKFGTSITAEQAILNKDFARFAAYQILLYKDRLKAKTAAFADNEDGFTTFTPPEYLHLVLLADFAKSLDIYLQSDTYHNDFTEIGAYETVPFWQSSGTAFALTDTSHINVILPKTENIVNRRYIVGCMFDRDACGIINERRDVAVSYNNRGRYYNNFYQVETRLFQDPAENCIVFTLGSTDLSTVKFNTSNPTTIPLTGASYIGYQTIPSDKAADVTFISSDESVCTVTKDPTSATTVVIRSVAVGTATVSAVIDEEVAGTLDVIVTDNQ